jgi:hypothetical protein
MMNEIIIRTDKVEYGTANRKRKIMRDKFPDTI